MSFIFFKKHRKVFECSKKNKNVNSVYVKSPSRLIVSGEHSSEYNGVSVACAISFFVEVNIKKTNFPVIIIRNNGQKTVTEIKDFSIEKKNNNILLEIIRRFFDTTKTPIFGIDMNIKNEVPVGYGFASSSSLICGIIFGLNELFNTKCKADVLMQMALNIENIFHGESENIDIHTIVRGGVLYQGCDKITKIAHPLDEIWLINTGRPSFSSKNVLYAVQDKYSSSKIWDEFREVSEDIAEIMNTKEPLNIKIAHNESLLEKIGIVKPSIVGLLKDLKKYDIYGKVCGYGTIADKDIQGGNGIVAIFQVLDKTDVMLLKKVCKKYHFAFQKVHISNAGVLVKSK